ncbi:nucleotidyltransferase domain-containing protein [Patescibacteria group bacterium]|nr:nucleotidyltransferase domain-containing protein [Patescibacteria group bacterium]MBU4056491.1 nucleotidyltransferase domain-containing protein [Patescibacteria group bacterium]MBU4368706.1 nucleotidyltransferase domain-containing protein [Patescibacteria group bacterium]
MFNLNSKIATKTLRYFFINPSKKNYINELARILKADPGNLSRKLQELENEGILSSEFSGEQRYYFINKKYPLLKEAKKAFELKYGLGDLIANSLKKIKGIKEAYIFGSYVKGDFEAESDIDILIIGDHPVVEATKALLPVQERIRREINVIDLTEKEFIKRKKNKDEFISDIFNGKAIKIL